jgi:hypothetical protein
MTTATISRPARPHHRGSQQLALDPYRIDEMTFTREEILRARGQWPSRPVRHRRTRSSAPARVLVAHG